MHEEEIILSAGIGLRSPHHNQVLNQKPKVPWWEIHTENFFAKGGKQIAFLEEISKSYPLSFHGVGLSLGSIDLPSKNHLKKIKTLTDKFKPFLVSDHISWSSVNHEFANDLLPIPYNEESLEVISRNIKIAQDYLGRQIIVENPSAYLAFSVSTMPEEDFINKLLSKTQCGLLLDVNNIFVSSSNNNYNPADYINNINLNSIKEIHLAGHSILKTKNFTKLLDTHNDFVRNEVWDLYRYTLKKIDRKVPTLIEWDADIPELDVLIKEASKAQKILDSTNESQRVTA
ncbi:MAG: DUF692 domain-containing protein [Rickettsiales bacterium]